MRKLLLCLILSIPSFASVANVYVAQTAAGGDTGASCANAHAVIWFNTSGNWGAGGTQVGPASTVHLCGTLTTALTVQGSGSSGSPITILFETGASMQAAVWTAAIVMDNRSYLIVDGGTPCGLSGTCNGFIANTGNRTSASHSASMGISADACDNCEIKNLGINNIYVHTGTAAEIDQTQVRCISYYGNNFLIHDNAMHDAGWCLVQDTVTPNPNTVRIYNNNLYAVDHGWALTLAGSTTTTGPTAGPYYFYNNHVHDYVSWDTASNAYHHDGIHCFSTGASALLAGAHISDFWIYNNLFDGDPGSNLTGHIFLESGIQTDGSQTPCMDATSKTHIFGNTFSYPTGRTDANGIIDLGVHSASSPMQNLDFYNNTVLGGDTVAGDGSIGLRLENNAASATNVKNNIFGGASYLIAFSVDGTLPDYNGYIHCASTNCIEGVATLAAWRTACNCDAHAVSSLGNMDGVIQATGVLQAGSIMIAAGKDLTTAVSTWPTEQQNALFTDRLGNPRGTTVWDIGSLSSLSAGTGSTATHILGGKSVLLGAGRIL